MGADANQGLFFPRLIQLGAWPIAAGIVRGCMVTETISQCFNYGWTVATPCAVECFAGDVTNCYDVVAVDLYTGDAGGDGFLCQGARGSLALNRHRDRPAVVDYYKHRRELSGTGEIDAFIESTFGCSTVADVGNRTARLAPNLECHGNTRAMQHLRGNRNAPGKVLPGTAEIAAPFIAAPIGQDFRQFHTTPDLGAEFAIHRGKNVLRTHGRAY